jgi:peptidyl-prolyl cis-trans isomerase SurA
MNIRKMTQKVNFTKTISYFAFALFVFCINIKTSKAQEDILLDEIVGVVGNHIILKSDVDAQYFQYRAQVGLADNDDVVKCRILEDLLFQKLLLHFGEVDSVNVSDQQIDQSIDMRINYFLQQAGSLKALEEYYGKPLNEIKEDMRTSVKDQMVSEMKKNEIVKNVTITPSEVKVFFKRIHKDSIPIIQSKYEFGQITKKPEISKKVRQVALDKITKLRNRIIKGEKFETLAILYSEDPGTAKDGGETGLTKRGNWDPAFTTAAFKLKHGEISEIIESKYGYHILKFIERKGDYINVRHILILLKPSYEDIGKAIAKLDSVANLIKIDSTNFEKAVVKYSDDPGRFTGGLMINQNTGNSLHSIEELDKAIAYELNKMEIGDVSSPVAYKNRKGNDSYRILYLKSKTLPHKANLIEDYNQIQQWALNKKREQIIIDWINEKIKVTYIRINKEYANYQFRNNWFEQ